MPRRKRVIPVLRVEGLSTGTEVLPELVDDFTGQRIERIPSGEATVPPQSLEDIARAESALRRARATEILQRAGMLPKPQGPHKLAVNEIMLGSSLVITTPLKPFRRI
jgi:hypothetical protein